MDRLVILGDANLLSTVIFTEEIIGIIRRRKDVILSAVVDTARRDPPGKVERVFQFFLVNVVKMIFNPEERFSLRTGSPLNLYDICRKHDMRVLVPPGRNVNGPDFVRSLAETVRPTLALSVGCLQIFKKPLIDLFDVFVNYHNGLLPKYRGLSSTSLSLYFGEERSGFTYHLVNEGIDEGDILLQDAIPVSGGLRLSEVAYEKTIRARTRLEELIGLMVTRSRGTVQEGESIYFGEKDFKALTTIDRPSEISYEEIERRLRSFEALQFAMNGEYYSVTRIRKLAGRNRDCSGGSFVTRDHVAFRPARISYLPVPLYRLYRSLQRLR